MATTEENDRLVGDHEYDGIREYDNPQPRWWTVVFVLTVVFSAGYFLYYHGGVEGRGIFDAYRAEMKDAAEQKARLALAMKEVTEDVIAAVRADSAHIATGARIFETRCAACHGAKGEGLVGPNLTDDYWLNGRGKLVDIFKVVTDGVPSKGMIPWGGVLTDEERLDVVSYVSTLRGTNPPNGRPPQGEQVFETR